MAGHLAVCSFSVPCQVSKIVCRTKVEIMAVFFLLEIQSKVLKAFRIFLAPLQGNLSLQVKDQMVIQDQYIWR